MLILWCVPQTTGSQNVGILCFEGKTIKFPTFIWWHYWSFLISFSSYCWVTLSIQTLSCVCLSSGINEKWKLLTLVSSDLWCRSSIPEKGKQMDETEQIVFGLGVVGFDQPNRTMTQKWHDERWQQHPKMLKDTCELPWRFMWGCQPAVYHLSSAWKSIFVLVTGILTICVFHYSIANEFVTLVFDRSGNKTVVTKACSVWQQGLFCCLLFGNYMLSL